MINSQAFTQSINGEKKAQSSSIEHYMALNKGEQRGKWTVWVTTETCLSFLPVHNSALRCPGSVPSPDDC